MKFIDLLNSDFLLKITIDVKVTLSSYRILLWFLMDLIRQQQCYCECFWHFFKGSYFIIFMLRKVNIFCFVYTVKWKIKSVFLNDFDCLDYEPSMKRRKCLEIFSVSKNKKRARRGRKEINSIFLKAFHEKFFITHSSSSQARLCAFFVVISNFLNFYNIKILLVDDVNGKERDWTCLMCALVI